MSPTSPVGYRLRTLGRIGLEGPKGDGPIPDPVALLVLCRVALAEHSVSATELSSWFYPDESPSSAASSLAGALATIPQPTAGPLIVPAGEHFTIAPDRLEIDVALDEHLPPLGSHERRQFLAGLPPVSPPFDHWVADVRSRIRRPADGPPRRLDQVTSAAIALGGFALLAAVYATRAHPPPDFAHGDGVGLVAIEAAADDTALAASLTHAAGVGLRQSPVFTLHGARPDMVGTTLAPLPVNGAKELALREGLRFVIRIRLGRDEDGYRLSGAVDDVVSGRSIALAEARAGAAPDAIVGLDRVIQSARRAFGERRTERAARSVPLPEATTASVVALRELAAGDAAWTAGDLAAAIAHWQAAVGRDPDFALAMVRLGQAVADREPGRAADLLAAAQRRPDRLTWRDRLEAEAAARRHGAPPR